MAKKHHPDVNRDNPDAEEKLKDMIPGVVFPKIDNPDIFMKNDAKTRNVDGKEFIFIESDKKEITDSKKNPSIKIKINGNDIDAELNKPKTIEFLDKIKKNNLKVLLPLKKNQKMI